MFGQVATKWIFKNIFKYFYWLKDFAIQIPNTLILQILTLNFHVFCDSLIGCEKRVLLILFEFKFPNAQKFSVAKYHLCKLIKMKLMWKPPAIRYVCTFLNSWYNSSKQCKRKQITLSDNQNQRICNSLGLMHWHESFWHFLSCKNVLQHC